MKQTNTKKGYKKTKLGLIPEEWKVVTLNDIGTFSKGKGIKKSEVTAEGLPCIRYAEIYTKYHNYTTELSSKIDVLTTIFTNKIYKGDLLFAGSGETLEDIGKCVAYLGNETAYAGGDIIILKNEKQDSKYLGLLLNNDIVKRQTHKLGQGHSVVHIYSSGLKKIKIPLPPLQQQKKIAKILSTWDVAINKQTQLIQAKQKQKKALMQLLLTGKKRFDGFTEEWRFFKLKDLLKYLQPTPYIVKSTEYKDEYKTPVLTAGKTFLLGHTNETDGIFIENLPVIIFDDFTTAKKYVDFPFKVKSSAMKILISNCDIDIRLIFEFMQQIKFVHEDHKRYWISEFQELEIKIPTDVLEQQKIAQVLSKADQEISLLKEQLVQLQQQKQGLMQVLLTGKVLVTV